ncbi:cyanoexosortase C [Alkalinema sp. FACHB-956]|uniref:cyanoexosortase C n=1 Tax=Alkalinema sp. FACHB-956 TaxID=2692768 RepID=UPI001688C467|nr:cyanoexosortase C [Alkalinema sp. FACHB-956]MBD2325253.1 cyanoexosortase C [Alkalinema sp. FACHB-956]
MRLETVSNLVTQALQQGLKTNHRRYITFASLIALCYLPTWITVLLQGIIKGQSDAIINIGLLVLGVQNILKKRSTLNKLCAAPDDRWLGYTTILCGILAFLFFHGIQRSVSLQALAVMVILIGIVWSEWGLEFFVRFLKPILLFLIGIYPSLEFIAIRICRFFTSEDMLERIMAWAGSIGLHLIGFKANAQAAYVTLPEGSVWVGPGCSGFSMAFVLVGSAFLLGQFMKLSWKKTGVLIFLGWALSMFANVPRIMLLAIASVYWGKDSFEFWHGPIGGQIFAGILFTIYYYLAMWIIDRKPKVKTN